MGQTYYEILGVAENATPEEIEGAFRKRAREVHPDTVAPGNAYLRQVAAEAFKDLSEAKATLLNPTEREKYDAKLSYERAAQQPSTASSAQSRSQNNSQARGARAQTGSSRSRTSPPRAQTSSPRSAPPRPPLRVTWKPLGSSLESFAFVLLGVLAIFFVGWLMASGRTPPWWAAILTLGLGVASFRHGLRPTTNVRLRGGMVPVLIGGFVVAAIFFSIWLPSTEFVLTRPTPDHAGSSAGGARNSKTAERFGSEKANAPNRATVTVDENGNGDPPGLVTRVWKDVREGRNYRTRSVGDVLFLEAVTGNAGIGGDGGNSGGIVHCDFHRGPGAGQDWSGVCSERNPTDQSIRYASANVSMFSETRLEGSTMDIPEFLMVPAETVSLGNAADRSRETVEPDLSGVSDTEKQSIETACASDKLMQGPAEYNRCVQKQLDTLRGTPKAPDLSSLSSHDRDSIELVCSNAKLMEGPAAYKQCLSRQLEMMKKQPR